MASNFTVDSSKNCDSFEARLARLAKTGEFAVPDEVMSYTRTVTQARETVRGVRRVLADSSVASGEFAKAVEQYCANIERVIESHDLEQVAKQVQERVDHYNGLIRQARQAHLQGTFLDGASNVSILGATESCPVDVQVPGLPTVCGVHGQQGVDQVTTLLADAREKQAEAAYNKIIEQATVKRYNGDPISQAEPVSIPRPKSKNSEGMQVGATGVGAALGGGASLGGGTSGGSAGGSGVPLPSFGAAGAVGAAGALGAVGAGAVAVPRLRAASAGVSSSSPVGASGMSLSGRGVGAGSLQGRSSGVSSLAGSGMSGQGAGVRVPSFDGAAGARGGEYVFDPVSGAWVKRDTVAASVDSAGSVNGFGAGVAGTVVGAGSAVAGARLSGTGGSAAVSLSGVAGAAAGTGGAVGAAGAVGGVALPSFGTTSGVAGAAAGSAVGSYFANTPVAATVTPSSSIRGAQGMAAGLPQSTVAAQSTAKSGTASPAMMAGGQGAGANNEKRERRGMAYVAPRLEDEEEDVIVKPRAAMAGHRKQMDI